MRAFWSRLTRRPAEAAPAGDDALLPDPLAERIDALARAAERRRREAWEAQCRRDGTADRMTLQSFAGDALYLYTYPPMPPDFRALCDTPSAPPPKRA